MTNKDIFTNWVYADYIYPSFPLQYIDVVYYIPTMTQNDGWIIPNYSVTGDLRPKLEDGSNIKFAMPMMVKQYPMTFHKVRSIFDILKRSCTKSCLFQYTVNDTVYYAGRNVIADANLNILVMPLKWVSKSLLPNGSNTVKSIIFISSKIWEDNTLFKPKTIRTIQQWCSECNFNVVFTDTQYYTTKVKLEHIDTIPSVIGKFAQSISNEVLIND